ncbi:MAG: activase [Desulfococcus sp. 4484_241]|nr:MAG: activase [Desulfococcus sp. 4484_241]
MNEEAMSMNESKKYYAGCDVGSTMTKAVIIDDKGIVATAMMPSGIDPEQTAAKVLETACSQVEGLEPSGLSRLIGTGYGRNEVPFAHANVSEITCHAAGVHYCNPDVRTVLDIGGQDTKAIAMDENGRVREFVMNDKCAAGTGRFLEMMSRIFNMDLDQFSDLSLKAKKVIPITSQCSVFAETEVISLLSKKNPPEDIAAGIQASIAKRGFTLLKRVGIQPEVSLTGGCAKSMGLVKHLERLLRLKLAPLPVDPQLMGALGAAAEAAKTAGSGLKEASAS